MPVFRIDSSDKQVFINNTRLMGVQACNIETDKDFETIRSIGDINVTDRILKSNQTTNLSIDFMLCDTNQNDPFFDFQTSGILSVEDFNYNIKDSVQETVITGAYMTSYSIEGAVGELVKGSVAYECDGFDFNNTGILSGDYQSSDSYSVYQPQDISISTDFDEGVSTSGLCIQNFSLNFDISRNAINRMGSLTPKMRYPELPAEGDLSFSVIKNKVTGIDLSSLVLDKGLLSITLNESQSNQRQYNINDCSLISISEGHSLDDNATLDFKYVFSVNKSDVYTAWADGSKFLIKGGIFTTDADIAAGAPYLTMTSLTTAVYNKTDPSDNYGYLALESYGVAGSEDWSLYEDASDAGGTANKWGIKDEIPNGNVLWESVENSDSVHPADATWVIINNGRAIPEITKI